MVAAMAERGSLTRSKTAGFPPHHHRQPAVSRTLHPTRHRAVEEFRQPLPEFCSNRLGSVGADRRRIGDDGVGLYARKQGLNDFKEIAVTLDTGDDEI